MCVTAGRQKPTVLSGADWNWLFRFFPDMSKQLLQFRNARAAVAASLEFNAQGFYRAGAPGYRIAKQVFTHTMAGADNAAAIRYRLAGAPDQKCHALGIAESGFVEQRFQPVPRRQAGCFLLEETDGFDLSVDQQGGAVTTGGMIPQFDPVTVLAESLLHAL